MLDILLEQFKDRFVDSRDLALVEGFLGEEAGRLASMDYHVAHLCGTPLFEWDARALDEGFLGLVRPYIQAKPWTSMLFLSALDDLRGERDRCLPAVLFMEYTHALSLINDAFNFHEEFLKANPDEKKCGELTQLKYAGQYLGMYSRYIITENRLGLDEPRLLRLYQLLFGMTVTGGISRGVFIKWSQELFQNLTREYYFQFAMDALSNYVQFPILLAAMLTGATEPALAGMRRAFDWLALGLKLRTERRIFQGSIRAEARTPSVLDGSLQWLDFQGFAFLHRGLRLDPGRIAAGRYPDIRSIHREIARLVEGTPDAALLEALSRREQECYRNYREELDRLGLLERTRARLEACLESEGPADAR